jgi:hypothetical protein
MAGVPRLLVTNRVAEAATVLTASSALTTAPVAWLKDQLRSKTWRSALGWTIVAGFNDKIDFNRGGVKVATITAGTYATGALLSAAIVTALEAADATPVWACAYSGTTFKFTVSSDLAFALLWASGANAATACHYELGFAPGIDSSPPATTFTSDTAVYTSRHRIKADLVTAASVQAGIVVNHNAGAGGTFTLQGNATDAWGTPTVNQALAGDANIRIAFIATQTLRYWRLVVNDCGNALGYSEVGIFFAGPYTQPSISYAVGMSKTWEELSGLATTPSGAHWQDERPRRPVWSIAWSEVPEADRATLAAAFALVPRGKCFFFAFDAVTSPTATEYGFLTDGVGETLTSGLYFDVPVPAFAGALG